MFSRVLRVRTIKFTIRDDQMYIRREGKELLESSEIKKIAAVEHRLADRRLSTRIGSDSRDNIGSLSAREWNERRLSNA